MDRWATAALEHLDCPHTVNLRSQSDCFSALWAWTQVLRVDYFGVLAS